MEPMEDIRIRHGLLIFADTPHSVQGTVAIIVKLLVHGRTLANLHHAHIRHQALQLIGGFGIHLVQQAIRPLKIHLNKSTESQVV